MSDPPSQSPQKHSLETESESPSKRPRFNQDISSQLLSKPFKSPLKRAPGPAAPITPLPSSPGVPESAEKASSVANSKENVDCHDSGSPTKGVPVKPARFKIPMRPCENDADGEGASGSSPTKKESTTTPSSGSTSTPAPISTLVPVPGPSRTPRPTLTTKPTADPRVATLQRQKRSLDRQLTTMTSQIESFEQAYRIEHRRQDAELGALIRRWRDIARCAAEEIFGGAKAKVEAMGGVRAWRGQAEQKKNGAGSWGWEEAAWESEEWGGGEEVVSDGEVERDRQLEKDALLEQVADTSDFDEPEGKKAAKAGDEQKEEEFTMDIMLKELKIDFKLIGYDADRDSWVD